jgi:hypothetical protein
MDCCTSCLSRGFQAQVNLKQLFTNITTIVVNAGDSSLSLAGAESRGTESTGTKYIGFEKQKTQRLGLN